MSKICPQKFFIYCALVFGVILIMIIPPFQSPDEDSHFKKAYLVSYGKFFPSSQDGKIGNYLPNKMIEYINEKLNFIGNRDKKYTYSELIMDDRLPQDYSDQTFQNFSTAEVTPIVYTAPAIGMLFSRIITPIIGLKELSITTMLYFARFFSLLLYITIVAMAIKTTPILKKTFCMIGLIPMSLSLAATISYDSVLIAISLLSVALTFKLIFDDNVKKVNYKYIIIFGIIGFILLSIKTVYITVLLPLIFVPKEKYGKDNKGIIKCFFTIVGISLGIYILNKIPSLFLDSSTTSDGIAVKEQLNMVLQHPIYYLKIWIKSMIDNRNYYYSGMFGIFGLSDTYVLTLHTVIYSIAFFMINLSDISLSNIKFSWKYKSLSLFGILVSIFGIFLAMYLLWTSVLDGYGVGAQTITGVQGRYFLPLLPMAIVLLSNNILEKNKKVKNILERILDNSYLVFFIMLLISSLAILLRFWC